MGHLWCWEGENITFQSGGQYQCATTDLARLSKPPTEPDNLAVSMQIHNEFWLE
ncbi:hypothetical protein [Candidatus Erwinia dacicola]|uniref:Uncharacterized protein n=1 Tax=Candidatus Erwinia dacicola TaxID=252393 RepID=A0A328TS27_9GAMM|nr:hypothetical protein ACZ87_01454 [Candidatus Erwinia dacicola]